MTKKMIKINSKAKAAYLTLKTFKEDAINTTLKTLEEIIDLIEKQK